MFGYFFRNTAGYKGLNDIVCPVDVHKEKAAHHSSHKSVGETENFLLYHS